MKKTLTVNLGGTVFHIDEDAYRLLDNYLANLKIHFKKQEGADEIVDDIETRISELFAEKLTEGQQVITIQAVEEVIARMGKPEEMESDSDEATSRTDQATSGDKSSAHESHKVQRRFYRNPDDKMLGGVASGAAVYFGWDVTLLRFILVLLLFFGFQFILPFYILCWIIVPEAKTAAEKLSMRGEEVTVENIGKTVTDGFDKGENGAKEEQKFSKSQSVWGEIGSAIVSGIGWILKIGLVLFGVICSPLLLVACIVFLVLLFTAIVLMFSGADVIFSMFPMAHFTLVDMPMHPLLLYINFTLFLGIPLLAIVYTIFRPLFKWQVMPTGLKATLIILWIISSSVFLFSFFIYGGNFPELFVPTHFV